MRKEEKVATIKTKLLGKHNIENIIGAGALLLETKKINAEDFAKAIDSDNNESPPSQVITIELDNKSPDIQMESPKDGDIIKNLDKRIIVKGKVNEKAIIKVNEKLAILKNDLSFEAILGVEEGNLEIKIVATDEAGNKKEESLKIKYEKKS